MAPGSSIIGVIQVELNLLSQILQPDLFLSNRFHVMPLRATKFESLPSGSPQVSFDLLLQAGLINYQGRDAFCRRVIFPCYQQGRVINLYGRSIGAAFPHRLLPRSKGGLFAWGSVGAFSSVILVEGLFDLAVLWQAGLRNTTCAIGTHLTSLQWSQLCDQPGRVVYIAFDEDSNQAGQQASHFLARRLEGAGLRARIVRLPPGQDPNSYFVAGATASDFLACVEQAQA
jgi:DNA primase